MFHKQPAINADKLDLWKFVDDTTMAEAVPSDGNSKIQESVDDFVDQTLATKFQLNEAKCEELRITFSKSDPILDPNVVNNQPLEIVKSAKLPGMNNFFRSKMEHSHHRNYDEMCPEVLLCQTVETSLSGYSRIANILPVLHTPRRRVRLSAISQRITEVPFGRR